tara:strand:- start:467 stop:1024 length:558 start_codon:yes stop_codon:yes gene_type:complete
MKKIIILASGSGSNTKNIIEYFENRPSIEISMVISNKRNAGVFKKVEKYKIPTIYIDKEFYKKNYLFILLENIQPDLIILAGFLLKIPISIINSFKKKIINIHPSILPLYGGKGMYGTKIHHLVKKNKDKFSGITIHFVNDEYDKGLIIFQKKVKLKKSDSVEIISKKVQELEHYYYPREIENLL